MADLKDQILENFQESVEHTRTSVSELVYCQAYQDFQDWYLLNQEPQETDFDLIIQETTKIGSHNSRQPRFSKNYFKEVQELGLF